MRIIGLTGRARAGKDTVAQIIEGEFAAAPGFAGSNRPLRFVRQGFADALKVSAARALGFDGTAAECVAWCNRLKVDGTVYAYVDRTDDHPLELTGREYLQRYGTEAHRDVFGSDFWLDAVLPKRRDDCDLLVIPDVRFPNEARRVRERGGAVWRITRPGHNPDVADHASEEPLPADLVDLTIWNNGTLDDLRDAVRAALGVRS